VIPFGIGLTFTGYGIGSWGWAIVKGYNITLREWFSPLNPYQWPPPGQQPQQIPATQIFPGKQAAASSGGGQGGGIPGPGGGTQNPVRTKRPPPPRG
jgi:hypothetical protein